MSETGVEKNGRNRRYIVLGTILVVLVSMASWAYNKRQRLSAEWRTAIVELHGQLKLGTEMRAVQISLNDRLPPGHFNEMQFVARAPFGWTTHNWTLMLDFDNDALAAVAIRSDDSLQHRPEGAPADKLKPDFRPYWEISPTGP